MLTWLEGATQGKVTFTSVKTDTPMSLAIVEEQHRQRHVQNVELGLVEQDTNSPLATRRTRS